jgi:hypothetical protein
MSKVTTGATMSLDGFIADANHGGFDYLLSGTRPATSRSPRATRT